MVQPEGRVLYIWNPEQVPRNLVKYQYPVVVDPVIKAVEAPPPFVVYHPHLPTFNRIRKQMEESGVALTKPLYGFMLSGKFHATPGVSGVWSAPRRGSGWYGEPKRHSEAAIKGSGGQVAPTERR